MVGTIENWLSGIELILSALVTIMGTYASVTLVEDQSGGFKDEAIRPQLIFNISLISCAIFSFFHRVS